MAKIAEQIFASESSFYFVPINRDCVSFGTLNSLLLMELSIFVAKIIALLYLAAGVAALRGVVNFAKIVDDFDKSPALTFITGLFTLIVGMLMVQYHNIWEKDWTVVITIFGWAAVIKGVMFIAFPGSLKAFKGMYKNTKAWGVLLLLVGVVFGYFGFIV